MITCAFDLYYNPNSTDTWQEVAEKLSKKYGKEIKADTLKARCYDRLKRLGLPKKKSELMRMAMATDGNELGEYLSRLNANSKAQVGQGVAVQTPRPQTAVNVQQGSTYPEVKETHQVATAIKPPSLFDRKFKANDEVDEDIKALFGI